jgi:hypothetical protein
LMLTLSVVADFPIIERRWPDIERFRREPRPSSRWLIALYHAVVSCPSSKLQILVNLQAILELEPACTPRSATAVRRPDYAMCQPMTRHLSHCQQLQTALIEAWAFSACGHLGVEVGPNACGRVGLRDCYGLRPQHTNSISTTFQTSHLWDRI